MWTKVYIYTNDIELGIRYYDYYNNHIMIETDVNLIKHLIIMTGTEK